MNDRGPRALTLNSDLVGGILLVAVAAVALAFARGATFHVWIYPRVTAVCLALIGAGLALKGLIAPERVEVMDPHDGAATVLPFAVGLIAYGVLLPQAGFVPTTIVLYAAATWVLRSQFTLRSALVSLGIGVAFTLVLHQVFTRVFYVPLPGGSWW